jgi:hypothetical protein
MNPSTRKVDGIDPMSSGDGVSAEILYAVDTGVKPVNETFGPGDLTRHRSGTYEKHTVFIRNGRPIAERFSLERNGFTFTRHQTAVTDFFDPPQIQGVYYPEIEALIQAVSGARRVVIFDHTLRSGDGDEREARKIREPVLWAHNDYTDWSGPQRLRDLLPEEAPALLQRRFAIIQVWRAIAQPIQSNPLAIADAQSIAPEDLLATERRYPNRVGETYQVRYNPGHSWVYFPRMARDEALVFKVYDSMTDGRARFTPHSSFADPNTPAGAPPRQSIEIRTIAFF